jgi:hypothetical protein
MKKKLALTPLFISLILFSKAQSENTNVSFPGESIKFYPNRIKLDFDVTIA